MNDLGKLNSQKIRRFFHKMALYYNGIGIRVDKIDRDTLERLATNDVRERLKYSSATTILQTYTRFLDNTSRGLRRKFGNDVDLAHQQHVEYRVVEVIHQFFVGYLRHWI